MDHDFHYEESRKLAHLALPTLCCKNSRVQIMSNYKKKVILGFVASGQGSAGCLLKHDRFGREKAKSCRLISLITFLFNELEEKQ